MFGAAVAVAGTLMADTRIWLDKRRVVPGEFHLSRAAWRCSDQDQLWQRKRCNSVRGRARGLSLAIGSVIDTLKPAHPAQLRGANAGTHSGARRSARLHCAADN
jgi:hypothetical protein